MLRIGALAKCAPPLRPKSAQDTLWEYLQAGQVTTIGSDHSPAPPEMKTDANFFKVWGGISSIQHTLPLLITDGHINRRFSLPELAGLLTYNAAKRFSIPSKGQIKKGMDADLAVVDLNQMFEVKPAELLYRHQQSAYAGRKLTGKVVQTILRGQTVFKDGKIVSKPIGRLVQPTCC
jgi:allantoinase